MKRTSSITAANRLGGSGLWAVTSVIFLLLPVAAEPLAAAADDAASWPGSGEPQQSA